MLGDATVECERMIDCYSPRIACRFIARQHYKEIPAYDTTPNSKCRGQADESFGEGNPGHQGRKGIS